SAAAHPGTQAGPPAWQRHGARNSVVTGADRYLVLCEPAARGVGRLTPLIARGHGEAQTVHDTVRIHGHQDLYTAELGTHRDRRGDEAVRPRAQRHVAPREGRAAAEMPAPELCDRGGRRELLKLRREARVCVVELARLELADH